MHNRLHERKWAKSMHPCYHYFSPGGSHRCLHRLWTNTLRISRPVSPRIQSEFDASSAPGAFTPGRDFDGCKSKQPYTSTATSVYTPLRGRETRLGLLVSGLLFRWAQWTPFKICLWHCSPTNCAHFWIEERTGRIQGTFRTDRTRLNVSRQMGILLPWISSGNVPTG